MESIFELHPTVQEELNKKANEKDNRRKTEILYLANKLFAMNKDGKRFLELMKEDLILRRETASPKLDIAHAYYTEGENNLIRRMSLFAELYPIVLESERVKALGNNQHKNTGDTW
ncbi:hypothetical protein GAMM_240002 [Gammaproteobacteria bacterium]